MAKFTIYASIVQELQVEIEADSLEEAISIADGDELISADFDCTNQDFAIDKVSANDSDEEFTYPKPMNR
jgi:hypothetical protein